MEPDDVLAVVNPHLPELVRMFLLAHDEFDQTHQAPLRLTVEEARAKWVNCRMLWHVEQRFGRHGVQRGSPRVMDCKKSRFSYLFVPGNRFDVGIRFKKLDDDLRTSQHSSGVQNELRQQRLFPEEDTAHVMLGYRQTDSLQPRVRSIFLTCEGPIENDWERVVWTEGEGLNPIHPTVRHCSRRRSQRFGDANPTREPEAIPHNQQKGRLSCQKWSTLPCSPLPARHGP